METAKIEMHREHALKLWRDYRKHARYSTPIDREVMTTYRRIAQGHVVIKALDSVRQAGLFESGLPKLAIARADATTCYCTVDGHGGAEFRIGTRWMGRGPGSRNGRGTVIEFPARTFEVAGGYAQWRYDKNTKGQAVVPMIPLEHRPRRGLENYHILWEADWKAVPVDPMLLRRLGRGDLWLVVAAWDLTEVERAAMAARVRP